MPPAVRISRGLVAGLGAAVLAGLAQQQSIPVLASGTPPLDHIFVIVMENHAYGEIIGSASAPYTNSLVPSGALATNYHAVTHPSLPNYLALTGASTFGITTDCTTCWVSAPNLGDSLEAAGKTWKTYEESMPSPCYIGDSAPYVQKHDPFIYFNDIRTSASRCQAHVVPYAQLATDLRSASTTPAFGFITPNMCDDTHDCSVATGDQWLRQQVPTILSSAAFTTQRSMLVLTWDEDDSSAGNQVATIFVGSGVAAGRTSATSYNHYSLLHTIETSLGAATLNTNDADTPVMDDMFTVAANPCAGMSASVAPASGAVAGTLVTVTAQASGCAAPRYEFWLRSPAGAWSMVRPYAVTNSFAWSTGGAMPGVYRFSVWARDATISGTGGSPPNTYDAFSAFDYTVSSAACAALSAAALPASPINVGAAVTFNGTATGCPNARYAFYLRTPSGAWSLVQGYSAIPSFSWGTAGNAPGIYRFSVWGRDASSTAAYDAFDAFDYTLNVAPCTGINVSTTPAGAAVTGGVVTLTAAAGGCPNPQYAVYLRAPSGAWTLVRGYSSSSTFSWNTAGAVAGTYRFSVWARDASSSAAYDAFSAFDYPLG